MDQDTQDNVPSSDYSAADDPLLQLLGREGILRAIDDALEIQELVALAEKVDREFDGKEINASDRVN